MHKDQYPSGAICLAWSCLPLFLLIGAASPDAQTAATQHERPGHEAEIEALAKATQRNESIVVGRSTVPPPTRGGGAPETLDHDSNQQLDYHDDARDLKLTFAQLETYWTSALPQVFGRAFIGAGPYHQYGPTDPTHAAVCAGQRLSPNNAFYCPDTDTVHWHGPLVVGLYQSYGELAAAYVWAHE